MRGITCLRLTCVCHSLMSILMIHRRVDNKYTDFFKSVLQDNLILSLILNRIEVFAAVVVASV